MWLWIDAHPIMAQFDMVFICLALVAMTNGPRSKPPRGGNPNAH